jgi:hypothetical protein
MQPYIKLPKPAMYEAQFRQDCTNGGRHPMSIESEDYIRVLVGYITSSITSAQQYTQFSEHEQDLFKQHSKLPGIEWANDNSFDGLYVEKTRGLANLSTTYNFYAYLKTAHATFWRLKFGPNGRG